MASRTSESLAFATYKEEVGRVTVVVGTFPAALNDGESYTPLQIAVGVRGRGPELTVHRESFVLIDDEGTVYPLATREELDGHDTLLQLTAELDDAYPLVSAKNFTLSQRVVSDFFPLVGVRYDRIHLSRDSYFKDVIYFPRPHVGLGGMLTLRVHPTGLSAPIEVRLEVPLKGKRRAR
jgi:hypothetical protein